MRLLILLNLFSLQNIAFAEDALTPPYYIEPDILLDVENNIDEKSNELKVKVAEHYLWYSKDNKKKNKGLMLLKQVSEDTYRLDIKKSFASYVSELRIEKFKGYANELLINLASLNDSDALELLIKGCMDGFYTECELTTSNYMLRHLVLSQPSEYGDLLICNNYYNEEKNVPNLILQIVLVKANLLYETTICRKKELVNKVKVNFVLENKVINEIPKEQIDYMMEYIISIRDEKDFLDKKYFDDFSKFSSK